MSRLAVLRGGDRDEVEAALRVIEDSLGTRQARFTVEFMSPTSNARTLDGSRSQPPRSADDKAPARVARL